MAKHRRFLGCCSDIAAKEANRTFSVNDCHDLRVRLVFGVAAHLLRTRMEDCRTLCVLRMGWCGKEGNTDGEIFHCSAAASRSNVLQAMP